MNILSFSFNYFITALRCIGGFLLEVEHKLDVGAEGFCSRLVDYYPVEHEKVGQCTRQSVIYIVCFSLIFFLLGWSITCVLISSLLYHFFGLTMPLFESIGSIPVSTRNLLWLGSPILLAIVVSCAHFLNAARRVWIH